MPVSPLGARPVVLDTDIGTDVDDALALVMLLGSPEARLVGVSTVYGDTALRARLAQRLLRLGGRGDCPAAPGAARPLSGRLARWAGWEGRAQPDLDSEAVDGDGVELLLGAAARWRGELAVAAIGPLTNIALAIQRDPSFATSGARLHIMGGALDGGGPEWNFACDPAAADIVLRSGMPIVLADLRIGQRTRFGPADLAEVEAARSPLSSALGAEVRAYWASVGRDWNTPHDPVALLPLLAPDVVGVERRQLRWDAATGLTRVVDEGGCAVDVVTGIDPPRAVAEVVRRLTAAASA